MNIFGIEYREIDPNDHIIIHSKNNAFGMSKDYLEDFDSGELVLVVSLDNTNPYFKGELLPAKRSDGHLEINNSLLLEGRAFNPGHGMSYIDAAIKYQDKLPKSLYEALTKFCPDYRKDEVKFESL